MVLGEWEGEEEGRGKRRGGGEGRVQLVGGDELNQWGGGGGGVLTNRKDSFVFLLLTLNIILIQLTHFFSIPYFENINFSRTLSFFGEIGIKFQFE